MNFIREKTFSVSLAIKEIITCGFLNIKDSIYSFKIDLPDELKIHGNAIIFKEVIKILIINADKTYFNHSRLKIILITCKLEDYKNVSISITSGGSGLSFFETKLIEKNILLLRDGEKNLEIYKINKIIKKEFKARMKIISRKNKGRTIKCFFPLD